MRVWLDLAKLINYRLILGDVRTALLAQNTQVSAGQLNGTPAVPNQNFTATITAQTRLQTVQEFKSILLRSSQQMMWRNLNESFGLRRADIEQMLAAAESQGPGTLSLRHRENISDRP